MAPSRAIDRRSFRNAIQARMEPGASFRNGHGDKRLHEAGVQLKAPEMNNTTLTFSSLGGQVPVEFAIDPTKPNWEDVLAAAGDNRRKAEQGTPPITTARCRPNALEGGDTPSAQDAGRSRGHRVWRPRRHLFRGQLLPWFQSVSARAIRSLSERPNRSRRQTTSVSPVRR